MKVYLLTAAAFCFHWSGVAALTHAVALESTDLHVRRSPGSEDVESTGPADTASPNDAQSVSPKLQIGTASGGDNVVADFEVVPSWQKGDDLESQVPAESVTTNFFLKVSDGTLQLTQASVKPDSLPHVNINLDGALAETLREEGQANLKPGETRQLTVVYECHAQGDVDLVLTLEFQGLSPVEIPWRKTCGGVQNTALTVTTGSSDEAEKVVIMGSPQWDKFKVVDKNVSVTKFQVYIDPLSEQPAQKISKPQAMASGVCSVKAESPIESTMTLKPGESVLVSVNHVCHHHGKCAVHVQVPFHPLMAPYRPTRWQYTKLCGTSLPGIEVEGEFQGKKKQLVMSDSHSSQMHEWLVGQTVDSHWLQLFNNKALSDEPEIKVQDVRVRCLDTLRCTARIASSIPEYLHATKPADVQVEYSCRTSGSSLVQLLLFTENREPVAAMWAKDCKAWMDSLWFILLASLLACTIAAFACIGCLKFIVSKEELNPEFYEEFELEDPDQMQDAHGTERWSPEEDRAR